MGAERKTAGGATPRTAQKYFVVHVHFRVPAEMLKRAIVFAGSHGLISPITADWLIATFGLREA